jgi:multisubunit Na+/H+ antiporter MnhB subunit
MVQNLFFYIILIIASIILIYLGLKISKHKRKRIKSLGYLFILIGLLGLLLDLYNLISGYIIK